MASAHHASPSPPTSNTRALVIFTGYLTINASLTLLIAYSTLRAYAQNARSIKAQNRSRILVFTLLTCTSLAVTWQYMIEFFVLSYRSWKLAKGDSLSTATMTVEALPAFLEPWLGGVLLGPWLKDVKLFREAWETVVEEPARTVWSMPIFFFTTGWSLFIMKEAVRRKIRYAWAYMVLGQLVAISFALNLFYLAVLVHPTLSESAIAVADDKAQKSDSTDSTLWTPPRDTIALLRLATFTSILLTVTSAGYSQFLLYLAIPHVLLLLPPIFRSILPRNSGTIQPSESAYDEFYKEQIKTVIFVGMIFETVAIFYAADISKPDRHLHRHSNAHMYPWTPHLLAGQETVFQNLWRSLLDHPAVSSVGSDSILCTASIFVWRLTSP